MVELSVALTIGIGILLARLLGYRNRFGVLTGGAVAICGASAAMAIAAVMPAHADDNVKERATIIHSHRSQYALHGRDGDLSGDRHGA
jgi:uncharacterized membrane protein YadS